MISVLVNISHVLRTALCMTLIAVFTYACQTGTGRETEPAQGGESQTQLRKLPVDSREQVDQLMQNGIELIVIEETYVIARLRADDESVLQTMGLQPEAFTEEELMQRLARIIVPEGKDHQSLVDLGLDVWEIKADTVLAQVFDKHILAAESMGYPVEIIENNVLNRVRAK